MFFSSLSPLTAAPFRIKVQLDRLFLSGRFRTEWNDPEVAATKNRSKSPQFYRKLLQCFLSDLFRVGNSVSHHGSSRYRHQQLQSTSIQRGGVELSITIRKKCEIGCFYPEVFQQVLRSSHQLPVCQFIKHISDLLLRSDPSRTSEVVGFRSALGPCSQNQTWRSRVQFYEAHTWNTNSQKPAGLLDALSCTSVLYSSILAYFPFLDVF